MTSFTSALRLGRFLLPLVLLADCGSRPLSAPNGSADDGGGGSPTPTANGGSGGASVSGTAGANVGGTAGVSGTAGVGGFAGVAGHAGTTPSTIVVDDAGTLVFAPGSAVFRPGEITDQLFRGGNYNCGPVPPYDPSNGLAVSLLGFGVSGDPGCNLFISLGADLPLNMPIAVLPGPPVMVSFTRGPNDEIIDPSFDVGGTTGEITLDFGQGLRRAPLLSGAVTVTVFAWPQRYGEAIKYRVQAALADGGFLDFVVTKVLVAPTFVACPPCVPGQFCPG